MLGVCRKGGCSEEGLVATSQRKGHRAGGEEALG